MVTNKYEEYAPALKAAIILRRMGTIDEETDKELGRMCVKVSYWAINEMVREGKLFEEYAKDYDFVMDVAVGVISALSKVDLERTAKEILIYLKRVGRTTAKDRLASMTCKKRTGQVVNIEGMQIKTDFYAIITP
ncbi:MAG: hypothetical protein II265_06180 [Clostridia bacterium]|nr:hypothetical protein [Clostridia bacterium]